MQCPNRIEVTMATIREIADKLGVSISTVSKGLNGASDISASTRQMVLDAALEMGYAGKRGKHFFGKRVCIVVMQLPYSNINEFAYELTSGFRLAATQKGYQVSIITLEQLEATNSNYDKAMEALGYSGAFFVGLTENDAYLKQFQNTRIPTVLFEGYVRNPMVSMVSSDLSEGIYQCVKHLYEYGHRTIAFINGPENCRSSNMRLQGYLHALRDFHLPERSELMTWCPYYPPEKAKNHVLEFLKAGVTGIVCANDYIAAAVISEARQYGKQIPQDLSVTGFDDIPLAQYMNPNITTINENRLDLGQTALKTLDALLHGDNLAICITHPRFINRGSTAAVPR